MTEQAPPPAKKKKAKKAKKKAKKKAGAKKKRKAAPIKKNVYVVEEFGEGHLVRKINNESSSDDEETYTVDPNGVCDCKASEFGTDCKHVAMTTGSLVHKFLPKGRAAAIMDDYIEQVLRPKYPRARIVSLVDYRQDLEVGNAAALACGVLDQRSVEKLTLWTISSEGLLLRIHCFRDLKRYRRALSSVRRRSFDVAAETPPVDVSAVGQTYGNQGEDT